MLLKKTNNYIIRGIAHDWFEHYLYDQEQFVQVKGKAFDRIAIIIGILQGTNIGLLLYLIYLDDIGNS